MIGYVVQIFDYAEDYRISPSSATTDTNTVQYSTAAHGIITKAHLAKISSSERENCSNPESPPAESGALLSGGWHELVGDDDHASGSGHRAGGLRLVQLC